MCRPVSTRSCTRYRTVPCRWHRKRLSSVTRGTWLNLPSCRLHIPTTPSTTGRHWRHLHCCSKPTSQTSSFVTWWGFHVARRSGVAALGCIGDCNCSREQSFSMSLSPPCKSYSASSDPACGFEPCCRVWWSHVLFIAFVLWCHLNCSGLLELLHDWSTEKRISYRYDISHVWNSKQLTSGALLFDFQWVTALFRVTELLHCVVVVLFFLFLTATTTYIYRFDVQLCAFLIKLLPLPSSDIMRWVCFSVVTNCTYICLRDFSNLQMDFQMTFKEQLTVD